MDTTRFFFLPSHHLSIKNPQSLCQWVCKMLQRQSSSSRAPDAEKVTQPIQQQAIYSPRNLRVYTSGGRLPLYFRPYNPLRRDYRETLRARLASEKLVHLIPVVLLLCLFILWWFSYPGTISKISYNLFLYFGSLDSFLCWVSENEKYHFSSHVQ